MNKNILAVILVVLGGVLLYLGAQRRDSLAGRAEAAGNNIVTAVDGEPRANRETLYFISGGILVVAGLFVALRRTA